MQASSTPQHWQLSRHGDSPGAQTIGSHVPATHDWQSPQEGTHVLGSHWKSPGAAGGGRSLHAKPGSQVPGHSPPQPSDSPQRRPSHDGRQTQREPVHTSLGDAHAVPALQVPPQPSLGRSPQGRVEGGAQLGAQHAPPAQRSPASQRVPMGQAGQPGASTGSTPHARVLAGAHVLQHAPPVQVLPASHCVPSVQTRQIAPEASRWSGMSRPHAMLDDEGQRGQQLPSMQSAPAGHIVPVPQSRHGAPEGSVGSGMGSPHATVEGARQLSQHTRSSGRLVPGGLAHERPGSQRVPKPVQVRQSDAGMGSPQSIAEGALQEPQHMPPAPPVHVVPAAQPAVP